MAVQIFQAGPAEKVTFEALSNLKLVSKVAGSKNRPQQHGTVMHMSAYKKQTGKRAPCCSKNVGDCLADSCMSFGIHFEELPIKESPSGAPSCPMFQSVLQEDSWMRDRTGEGMMAGKSDALYAA